MTQLQYDRILQQLTDPDDIQAMKKLWRDYQRYLGAARYSAKTEVHVHYDAKEADR